MKIKFKVISISLAFILFYSCNVPSDGNNNSELSDIKAKQEELSSKIDKLTNLSDRLGKLESAQKGFSKTLKQVMTNLKNPSAKDLSKKPPAKNQKPSNSKWKRDFKYSVSDNDSYYAGPANAKVVITEFSDYY